MEFGCIYTSSVTNNSSHHYLTRMFWYEKLLDKNKNMESFVISNYLNMDDNHKYTEFYYEFKFGENIIIYKYKKENLYKVI